MIVNWLGNVCSRLYQADGGGAGGGSNAGGASGGSPGGGGGNTSPGTGGSSQGGGQQNQNLGGGQPQGGASNPGGTSEPLDWDGKRLYRVPGRKDPITGEEYVKGFQSQFTRASQEAAKAKKEAQQYRQELDRIRQAAGGGQGGNGDPNAGSGAQMLSEIEAAPFIDGKTMGGVIKDFQAGIRERDMVMYALLNKFKQIESVLGELHGSSLNQQHQTKLNGWLEAAGLGGDQDAMELADIIYRGYEGDNLDEEFPQIFQQRWKQMQSAVQRRLQRDRDRSRQLPWVPGKGGNAGPGKAQGLSGRETPKELADIFFNRFGGQAET